MEEPYIGYLCKMSGGLTLEEMTLLALGVPEEVKFNMLRALLLSLLKKLNIGSYVAMLPEKDGDNEWLMKLKERSAQILSQLKERALSSSDCYQSIEGLGGSEMDDFHCSDEEEEEQISTAKRIKSNRRQRPVTTGSTKKRLPTGNHSASDLEAKVADLEHKLDSLSSLPTAKQVIERAAETTRATESGQQLLQPALVSDLWQAMQMQQKIETNEQGVTQVNLK